MTGLRLMVACSAFFAAVPVGAAAAESIRDIHGPLPLSGLPPGIASLAVVFMTMAALLLARTMERATENVPLAAASPGSLAAELHFLRDACERGEVSARQLFDRFTAVVRSSLTEDGCSALTSEELINDVRGKLPEELLQRAGLLLALCDRVRFGGYVPGREVVLQAVDDAIAVVNHGKGSAL